MRRLILQGTLILMATAACVQQGVPTATHEAPHLATPVSDTPAAGICSEPEEQVVTVTIFPDIPDPRCTIVRADQQLRVVNGREETIQVAFVSLEATIEPGGEAVFATPFGNLLEPGVHIFTVSPCCGAELWLR